MCQPFSCIVKSDLSVLVGGHVAMHSHTQIIKHHGLPQEVSLDQYARVELLPENKKYGSDPATWTLELDEGRVPSWWEENLPEINDRVIREAQKWQAKLFQLAEFKVEDNDYLICCGSSTPQITQSGGEVWTYGSSIPQITQSGGEVWTYDSSTPQITQSGGVVRTYDSSTPQITQSGGEVWTYDSSTPQITQSGGVVRTYGSSIPQITQSGGEVWTYGSSTPQITQSGGVVRTYGSSTPQITKVEVKK